MALRVVIVEDSLTVRRRLCDAVASDPELVLIAEVSDGARAIEVCRALRPDVIAMDMMLPVMTGLEATEYIMAHFPTPILIVSASVNRGELFCTYDALAAGAVDVLDKPRGDEADGAWERTFVATLKLVARIRVITHPRARLEARGKSPTPRSRPSTPPSQRSVPATVPPIGAAERAATPVGAAAGPGERTAPVGGPATPAERGAPIATAVAIRVVALGASTGGPGAIAEVLRGLPVRFQLPILLVLHIGETFASALADWLDGQSSRRVAHARDGELVSEGRHQLRSGSRVSCTRPARNWCRPSVDVLFESVAVAYGAASAGCLLTGMGRDGAAGLLAIRAAGGYTISQDEASCVVYGMPREAELLGASLRVLPLSEIAATIAALEPPARRA